MWISYKEKIINLRRIVVIFLLVTMFSIWKINGVFHMSWFWVFSPIWITILILFICAVVIVIFYSSESEEM